MIAVFAVAAAICLRGFAVANKISKDRGDLDAAVLLAQDACEILKYTKGDMEDVAALTCGHIADNVLWIYYDQEKNTTDHSTAVYVIKASPLPAENGVGMATIEVYSGNKPLYDLTVAWQEETNENK